MAKKSETDWSEEMKDKETKVNDFLDALSYATGFSVTPYTCSAIASINFTNSDDWGDAYIGSWALEGFDESNEKLDCEHGTSDVCQCGSEACGSPNHSSWCPMAGGK